MLNEKITKLTDILRSHFTGKRSRIKCMATIILGLLSAETVNLSLDEATAFVLFIVSMNGGLRLVFNRTNWKFGKSDINYFVLAIFCRKVSIPIYCINLDNRRCSRDKKYSF